MADRPVRDTLMQPVESEHQAISTQIEMLLSTPFQPLVEPFHTMTSPLECLPALEQKEQQCISPALNGTFIDEIMTPDGIPFNNLVSVFSMDVPAEEADLQKKLSEAQNEAHFYKLTQEKSHNIIHNIQVENDRNMKDLNDRLSMLQLRLVQKEKENTALEQMLATTVKQLDQVNSYVAKNVVAQAILESQEKETAPSLPITIPKATNLNLISALNRTNSSTFFEPPLTSPSSQNTSQFSFSSNIEQSFAMQPISLLPEQNFMISSPATQDNFMIKPVIPDQNFLRATPDQPFLMTPAIEQTPNEEQKFAATAAFFTMVNQQSNIQQLSTPAPLSGNAAYAFANLNEQPPFVVEPTFLINTPPLEETLPPKLEYSPPFKKMKGDKWTPVLDCALNESVEASNQNWDLVALSFPGKLASECESRWRNNQPIKGKWSAEEDALLLSTHKAVTEQESHDPTFSATSRLFWYTVSEMIPGRGILQCSSRYNETLDPSVKKGKWSPEEDAHLREGYELYGNKWVKLAAMVHGRTQRQCRTRYGIMSKKVEESVVSPREDASEDSDAYDANSDAEDAILPFST